MNSPNPFYPAGGYKTLKKTPSIFITPSEELTAQEKEDLEDLIEILAYEQSISQTEQQPTGIR
jgi:hypothetical protein